MPGAKRNLAASAVNVAPILPVLEALPRARPVGKGWVACCPAHEDSSPSLSWTTGADGRTLLLCRAGCPTEAIVAGLGAGMADLFAADGPASAPRPVSRGTTPVPESPVVKTTEYQIRDTAGELVAVHVRRDRADGSKDMPWSKRGIAPKSLPLFGSEHLPSWPPDERMVICEGEKAASAVLDAGRHALGIFGADCLPEPAVLESLSGRHVVLSPDNDAPGRQIMRALAAALTGIAASVLWLEPPDDAPKGWDLADALEGAPDPRAVLVALADRIGPVPTDHTEPEPETVGRRDSFDPVSDDWPAPPDPAAFHGLAGEIVDAVADGTEADRVALLGTFLAAVGALCDGPMLYQGSPQTTNLYLVLVGDTSSGRKGTAWSVVRSILTAALPGWQSVLVPGLGSGEALIKHLQRAETDPRALILETELGRLLGVMSREGSVLSPVLRDGWDGTPMGRVLAKESAIVMRHHVGLLGHITPVELRDKLRSADAANGFANRMIWLSVRRSRLVPFPVDPVPAVASHLAALRSAVEQGATPAEYVFSDGAKDEWEAVYLRLALTRKLGLAGALTARAEAQVARLALLYAVLDRSPAVEAWHLKAAVALWEYAERSARHVFGDSVGDPWADAIRLELRRNGPATVRDLKSAGYHDPARLGRALALLENLELVARTKGQAAGSSGGRPSDVIRSTEVSEVSEVSTPPLRAEKAGER